MKKKLKERLAKIISEFEGIRYVYITKKDAFFIFKKVFRDYEHVDENYSADENGRPYFDGWVSRISAFDDCAILHNNKLIQGKRAKAYIVTYREIIEQSPEFLIDDILEKKAFKVFSKRYLTPIKDLFREIFLLKDGRAGRQPVDRIIKIRNDFFVRHYIKLGSPKRIPMQEIQKAWGNKLNKLFPNDLDAVEKYEVSDDTVRKKIKCRIKK